MILYLFIFFLRLGREIPEFPLRGELRLRLMVLGGKFWETNRVDIGITLFVHKPPTTSRVKKVNISQISQITVPKLSN